jgi:hypothetical protein
MPGALLQEYGLPQLRRYPAADRAALRFGQ